ncbi:MAG: 6-phosphogluconolactonase [Anaerolineae bacterium]|nr:6-phosphogluconolactonase [Anaerolineae bacterium]
MMAGAVRVFPNRLSAARGLAALVARNAEACISLRERFSLVLSGGKTPREAYKLLGDEMASEIDWTYTHVFWSDERCVPYEHLDNNAKMARETLLDYVPIPMDHIHRVQSFLEPAEAAEHYQKEVLRYFESRGSVPRFDLILLGIGADGHTASLFPGTQALQEVDRLIVPNYVSSLDSWRITMTLPLLNAADHVVFYVLGEDKAETLARILSSEEADLPAARINPPRGKLTWIVDEEAASLLPKTPFQ